MKLIWLSAPSPPIASSGPVSARSEAHEASRRRSAIAPYSTSDSTLTTKAMSSASAPEVRTHSESVETSSIPSAARPQPRRRLGVRRRERPTFTWRRRRGSEVSDTRRG